MIEEGTSEFDAEKLDPKLESVWRQYEQKKNMIEEIGESSKPQETGNSVPTEEPQNKPAQTPNTKSRKYDFDSAKEKLDNIQAAITNSPSEETKGLVGNVYDTRERITELKDGTFKRSYDEAVLNLNSKLNKVNSQMTDLIADKDVSLDKKLVKELKKNFIDTQAMDEVVTESKFNLYRSQYKNNMDHIEEGTNFLKKTKEAFARDGINIEDKEMQATFKKIGEAREKYIQSIKDQNKSKRIIGEKPKERAKFNLNEYTNYVENEVFGTAGNYYNRAIITYDRGNRQVERLKKIQNSLSEKIEGMIDKDGNFSYKKAVESSKAMGWKGKAAIFGGVALGALALVGVASMVMSGGRQQNSNLYNPYQAMY